MDDRNVPTEIYRYRSYTAEDLGIDHRRQRLNAELLRAQQSEVWFSPLTAQNDPFDTNPHFFDSPPREIREFLIKFRKKKGQYASFSGMDYLSEAKRLGIRKGKLKKKLSDWPFWAKNASKAYRTYRSNVNIACFAGSGFDLLLWSYYAKSHCSFCFVFGCDEEALAAARMRVAAIKYVKARPQLSTLDMIKQMVATTYPEDFPLTKDEEERYTDALVLTKSEVWKRESEYRALTNFSEPAGYHSIAPYKLKSIIFGCRASDSLVQHVRNALSLDADLRKTVLDTTSYSLIDRPAP
jgi:hypothetical protein